MKPALVLSEPPGSRLWRGRIDDRCKNLNAMARRDVNDVIGETEHLPTVCDHFDAGGSAVVGPFLSGLFAFEKKAVGQ